MDTDQKDPFDWNADRPDESRFPPTGEYSERRDALLKVGVKVRARVGWSHLDHPPSLMIYVDALPENEQPEARVQQSDVPDRFRTRHSRWTSDETINPAVHYHITICKADELRSVDQWRYKLYYIYAKFDDKVLWLYPYNITSGSALELSPQMDPIASDPVVQEIHSKHLKWNRQADGSWTSRVAPLHVSM